jgi:cation diffusion facilitator CzcD-associated flavoprotein CzcO
VKRGGGLWCVGVNRWRNAVSDVPDIRRRLRGRIVHSSQFGGGEEWHGKHCVVLGANNSAHDIAADLFEHGAAEVTMVQRSSTVVVTSDALMEHAWGRLYSEEAVESGITTEIADLTVASVPFKLLPAQRPIYGASGACLLYAGLEKAASSSTSAKTARASTPPIFAAARATTSTWALRSSSWTAASS